jgi:hypothetical protein
VLAVGLIAILPAAVLAHPLGNFTINHYAGMSGSSPIGSCWQTS